MLTLLESLTNADRNLNQRKQQRLVFVLIALVMLLVFSMTGCAGIDRKTHSGDMPLSTLDSFTASDLSNETEIILSTDQGVDPVFRAGDETTIRVGLSADGYLNCFYQPDVGQIIRLFPNRFASTGRVAGQTQLKIPAGDEFAIQFDRSGVKEQILCLFSDADVNRLVAPQLRDSDLEPLDLDLLSSLYNRQIATLDHIYEIYRSGAPQHRVAPRLLTLEVR